MEDTELTADVARLEELLKTMDVPERRREINYRETIFWLGRNLPIKNLNHPNLNEAMILLSKIGKSLVSNKKNPKSSMKTAKYLKDIDGFTGHAALYELTPPLKGSSYAMESKTMWVVGDYATILSCHGSKEEATAAWKALSDEDQAFYGVYEVTTEYLKLLDQKKDPWS